MTKTFFAKTDFLSLEYSSDCHNLQSDPKWERTATARAGVSTR